jgi:hypothetical protein
MGANFADSIGSPDSTWSYFVCKRPAVSGIAQNHYTLECRIFGEVNILRTTGRKIGRESSSEDREVLN